MVSSKRHCKNLFYNFPHDLPLSPWIFKKISGCCDKHRDKFYSRWTKLSAWTFTQWVSLVCYKILAAPVGVLHTHLTTDVIYSHMHKDGSLFYAFQVHVSVTWNRGSRAGSGLGQVTGGTAGDFPSVSSRRDEAGLSQPLLTVRIQAPASPCHTQVPQPHHWQTSPPFFAMIS